MKNTFLENERLLLKMFLDLSVCIETSGDFEKVSCRSDETIQTLKQRIIAKFSLGQPMIDLRTLDGQRDLNQDARRVGEMGVTNETCLLVLTSNRGLPT